ncbi:MAG: nitrile hydratase subunit alpha [Candidatus Dormibacteria bacterium]
MSDGHHHDGSIAQQVRELEAALEDHELIDGAELEKILDSLRTPEDGARVVARAWLDPAFRDRLLTDGTTAVEELGYRMTGGVRPQVLVVIENTDSVHNVIVCTLCSCYPIALLGPSPHWYKSEAYRSRIVRDPRSVLTEFGLELAETKEIRVWDASAETRYLVLPQRPGGTEGLNEAELAERVTRNGMIGTALV